MHDKFKHSERSTGLLGSHLNRWRSRASHRCTVANPSTFPGQTRRPDPNGASVRSDPMMEKSCLSVNVSGLKAHESSQIVARVPTY